MERGKDSGGRRGKWGEDMEICNDGFSNPEQNNRIADLPPIIFSTI
jgi:hypothetical protein